MEQSAEHTEAYFARETSFQSSIGSYSTNNTIVEQFLVGILSNTYVSRNNFDIIYKYFS